MAESPAAIYKSLRTSGSVYGSPDSVSAYAGENIGATSEKMVQKAIERGGEKYRGRSPMGVNIFGIEGHNKIRNTVRESLTKIKSLPTQFTETLAPTNSPKLLRPLAIKAPLNPAVIQLHQKKVLKTPVPMSLVSPRSFLTPTPSPINISDEMTNDENEAVALADSEPMMKGGKNRISSLSRFYIKNKESKKQKSRKTRRSNRNPHKTRIRRHLRRF